MFLTVIIPLFNEEKTITEVIKAMEAVRFPDVVERREVIVVDDCSRDRSADVVGDLIRDMPQYKLLRHPVNKGKGAAIHTAIAASRGDTFVIQDADMELDPHDLPVLINAMTKLNIDFVNGSRFLPGIVRPLHAYNRYFGNKVFSAITSLLINVHITDMACCYKLFTRKLLDHIELHEQRFGFEAEIIIKAIRFKRNNVAEVPVQYFPRNAAQGKKIRWHDGFRVVWTILKYGIFNRK
jgi:glycosyltransferase involved in cell wall biosynthesis